MKPHATLAALALCAAAVPSSGLAQAPVPGAGSVSETPAVIAALRAILRDRYVLPDTAAALDRALTAAEGQGDFAGLSGEALADKVNQVMRAVTPDGHLGMRFDPRRAALAAAGPPPGEGAPGGGPPPEYLRSIARANGGVAKLELLEGNIRYLDYTGFMWGSPDAERAIAAAAEFLRGGDAVIIDLRRNGGGSPDAVAALASYFLPPDTPLMRFEMRGEEPSATTSHATPFTLAGKPAYVLTSDRTFSAAEEFSAHVDAFDFATLVGETTGGGGFRNDLLPLPGGYMISVSTGQAIQAKTGKGWERTGIAPDIAVPADRALDRARAEAMGRIAAAAAEPDRAMALKLAAYYRALADRFQPPRPLSDYAGTYGDRAIALDASGALTTRRGSRPAARLVAVGPDLFAPEVAPAQQFRFVAEAGRIAALEVDGPGGPQRAPREAN